MAERESQPAHSRRGFFRTTAVGAAGLTLGRNTQSDSAREAAHTDEAPKSRPSTVAKKKLLTVRAHHLFDMLGALESGKSTHKTLWPVAKRIRANPKVPIKVVIGVDDICSPCKWWDHKRAICTSGMDKYPRDHQDSIDCDKNAIRTLGLKQGKVMNADDIYRLIQRKVNKKVFAEQVCVTCRLVDKCKETYERKIKATVNVLSKQHLPAIDSTRDARVPGVASGPPS